MKTTSRKRSGELDAVRRRFGYLLGFAFLFSIFVNLLMLTGPLFMLQVYDRVLGSRSEETLAALLLLVVFLYGLLWLLEFARTRLVARFGARFQSALDDRVFRAQLTRSRHDKNPEAASALHDLDSVQSLCASPALLALFDMPFTPVFIAAVFVFHPWLGLLALGGGLSLVGLAFLSQILTRQRISEAKAAAESAGRYAEDIRRASELIRSQAMTDDVVRRWTERRERALSHSMKAVDWTTNFTSFTRAFRLLLQSLILALGAWLVLRGELTGGAMIAASILLGRALAPVEQVLGRLPQIIRAREGWASLDRYLTGEAPAAPAIRLPRPTGQLQFKAVTVLAGSGRPALLNGVAFALDPGQAIGVIGRSGSGKTTIAKTILGLVTPDAGEIRLGGALISHYASGDLGRHVGYLPQDAQLISGTIAENIARMAADPDSAEVVKAACKANAHELILSLPDGYQTQVNDGRLALSGGQRQRIALARALFGDPVLLVLDEPNSALDMEGSEALNAAIREMKSAGKSIVIMTHRPLAISECDSLMIIDAGKVQAVGPRDVVLKSMMKNSDEIRKTLDRAVVA